MERIDKRGRDGEIIDTNYQQKLMIKCKQFFDTISQSHNSLQLNCNSDYTNHGIEQDHIVNMVQKFLD